MIRKCVLMFFTLLLLVLVATQLLDLWPHRYLPWVRFASVACIIFAIVMAWCFHDVAKNAEPGEDRRLHGELKNDSDAFD